MVWGSRKNIESISFPPFFFKAEEEYKDFERQMKKMKKIRIQRFWEADEEDEEDKEGGFCLLNEK